MRLSCYLFGILSLMGAMCACDDDAADGATVSAGTEISPGSITYLNVSLAMAGSGSLTRSTGDYDYGKDYENAVESCLLLFYDDEGEYMASSELTDTDNITWEYDANNVAGTYTTVLILGLTSYPTQVLAILNYSGSESLKGKPLEEVLEMTVEALPTSSSEGGDFIMSNSVYVKDGKFVYAQPVEESYFYGEGEESTESLTIYVEREVAKVTIETELEKDNYRNAEDTEEGKYYAELQDDSGGGNYLVYFLQISSDGNDDNLVKIHDNLAFRIYVDGWAVNATNEEGYLVKKVKDDWLKDGDFTSGTWYNSEAHRTWWAYDDNYDSNNNVTHFTWNNVADNGTSDEAAYYHENTASYTAQTTYNQPGTEACTPTLIVAAHIAIHGEVPITVRMQFVNKFPGQDIFYKNGIYYCESSLSYFIAEELNDWGYSTAEGGTLAYDDITLSVSGGELTWGLDDGLALYKDGSEVEASEWPELSITDGLTIFKEGACYYQIPITQDIYSGDIDDSATTTSEDDKTTYCGLVRNHSYEIILNSISGVGHNVADLDEDLSLIPSDGTSYLSAYINILDWELVEQTVYINSENNE